MCNNPVKSTWFNGNNPLVYSLKNRSASNLVEMGTHNDNRTIYSFMVGSKYYLGLGELTSSGKNFKYISLTETSKPATDLARDEMEAVMKLL